MHEYENNPYKLNEENENYIGLKASSEPSYAKLSKWKLRSQKYALTLLDILAMEFKLQKYDTYTQ